MVLDGIVNKSLVAAIALLDSRRSGCAEATAGRFARARNKIRTDLGFVGEICFSEPRWIRAIWTEAHPGFRRSLWARRPDYNVNADQDGGGLRRACRLMR